MPDGAKSKKIKAMFHGGRRLSYQKNEIILRANDTPKGVYLIDTGMIKIYSLTRQGDEHVHHFFGSGDFFPMIWTFRGFMRNVYYETLEPATIWLVPHETFIEFITNNRDVMFELLEEMVDRYRLYAGRIDNLLYSDARERCAYRLLSLAHRFGLKTNGHLVINATITHEDMAHSINMTRETFGRSLGRLQRKNIIGYDSRHRLIIKDLSALISIIGREETATMWPELMKFVD